MFSTSVNTDGDATSHVVCNAGREAQGPYKPHKTEMEFGLPFCKNLRQYELSNGLRDITRNRGRPPARWTDDTKRTAQNWRQKAQNRDDWNRLRQA